MAILDSRDAARTGPALAAFLRDHVAGFAGADVELVGAPGGTGFSGDTLAIDALVPDAGGPRRVPLVARLQPESYSLYRDHDLTTQWRVIDVLHRCTDVPVPRIVAHDTTAASPLGAPFFVMDRIDGHPAADAPPYTVKGWLHDSSPEQQRQVWTLGLDVLARIHRVDWEGLGLGFLRENTANPVGLRRQQADDAEFLGWAVAGRTFPVFDAAAGWLADHVPDDGELALSWGDARLGNMLFREHRPVAVLDWEMVTLAAPGADVGWWLVFNLIHTVGIHRPNLPGFPDDDDVVAEYERRAGRRVSDLHFYEVRAALRAGLLLLKYADALAAAGRLDPAAPRQPYTPAVHVLEHLLG
jgi:aminoglycoside phosphotransferase (APT) family kinase protein